MKRSYLVAFGLAVAVAAWILSGQVGGNRPPAELDAKAAAQTGQAGQAGVPQVRVRAIAAEERLNELTLFGRTEAVRKVELKAEIAGRVVARSVKKGQRVDKGAVVVRLAMDDRQARLQKAEAVLERHTIAYDAAQQLSKKQFRSKVKLAETRADLAAARAELAAIKLDIARTGIHAPFAGVVDGLPVEVGGYVAVGDPTAIIVDLNPMLVIGEVAEGDIAKVAVGATARVRLANGEDTGGKVRFVSKVGAEQTRTFRIEVALDNPGGVLTEGLTTEIRLPLETVRAHRVSPAVLTLSDAGVIGVKIVDEEDTVRFRPVGIVADTPEGIWLTGLPDRATVITVGQEFVLPGQKVVPVPEGDGN